MDPLTLPIAPLLRDLWELARLAPGWDGHEAPPPSPVACERVHQTLSLALARGLAPTRLVPDVNGGLAVYWFGEETLPGGAHCRVAALKVTNEGEIVAREQDRTTGEVMVREVTQEGMAAEVERLATFAVERDAAA